jgi:hypothetical protein
MSANPDCVLPAKVIAINIQENIEKYNEGEVWLMELWKGPNYGASIHSLVTITGKTAIFEP